VKAHKMKIIKRFFTIGCLCLLYAASTGAKETYRGLWVGQVTLTHVNEVTIPLDENNIAIAPNPDIPTNTADAAHLRLILHVDGAGQVNLLKDVAILKRDSAGDTNSVVSTSESGLALVSDERLYTEFPAQEATRIASAVFDFGDFKATEALDEIVDVIASNVAASVENSGIKSVSTTADIRNAEDHAQVAAETNAVKVINQADVASAFDNFMINQLTSSKLEDIAKAGDPADEAADIRLEAVTLTNTFYGDTRALDVIDAIVDAVTDTNLTTNAEKIEAAQYWAARYVDTDNEYQRFITGDDFGDMIPAAARTAAAAVDTNATKTTISIAVNALTEVSSNKTAAALLSDYSDTAASDTFESVLDAIIETATSFTNSSALELEIAEAAETAGIAALEAAPRFSLPTLTPTVDYTTFVQADEFMDCVPGAAEAAAVAAVAEKKNDPFSDEESLTDAARIAATEALRSVYILAAKARRTELPMAGTFGPGIGDPRLTSDAGVGSLGDAALECEISLPASHPTNPFRHPKHPDHTVGIDIRREIRMDFDEAPGRSDAGLDRMTGIYREEVFGLHKPLGPKSDTGLKVEGTFELNRISLIDTLNAR